MVIKEQVSKKTIYAQALTMIRDKKIFEYCKYIYRQKYNYPIIYLRNSERKRDLLRIQS